MIKEQENQHTSRQEFDDVISILNEKKYSINEVFEILLPFFTPLINYYLRKLYAKGEDTDDLYQQGLIGLYNAIKSYNPDKGAHFYNHANRCIRLSILNLVRATTAQKCQSHLDAVSLDAPRCSIWDENIVNLYSFIKSNDINPEKKYINHETEQETFSKISIKLSALELKVICAHIEGYSYEEIAKMLNVKYKTVDNALTRIKRKLSPIKDTICDNNSHM